MKRQRGNILFLILLVIILFVALTYAVNSGMRGGGNSASKESAQAQAAQMLQYASLVENTIRRAMLVNNVPEYGFDVNGEKVRTNNGSTPTSNAACSNSDCILFDKSGVKGLMASISLPKSASADGATNIYTKLYIAKLINIGTDLEDVLLVFNDLSRSVCEAVNEMAKFSPNLGNYEGWGGTITNYNGTLTSIPASGSKIGDEDASYKGQPTGCFSHSSLGYTFYHVILTR